MDDDIGIASHIHICTTFSVCSHLMRESALMFPNFGPKWKTRNEKWPIERNRERWFGHRTLSYRWADLWWISSRLSQSRYCTRTAIQFDIRFAYGLCIFHHLTSYLLDQHFEESRIEWTGMECGWANNGMVHLYLRFKFRYSDHRTLRKKKYKIARYPCCEHLQNQTLLNRAKWAQSPLQQIYFSHPDCASFGNETMNLSSPPPPSFSVFLDLRK